MSDYKDNEMQEELMDIRHKLVDCYNIRIDRLSDKQIEYIDDMLRGLKSLIISLDEQED